MHNYWTINLRGGPATKFIKISWSLIWSLIRLKKA